MERLQERIMTATKALRSFEEIMNITEPDDIVRDAAIQRFEFTFEAIWKAAKEMLFEIEGVDVGSPKGVVRSCREVGLFDEKETVSALKMVDDRNLTVHTYNEKLAEEIYGRLPGHLSLMQKWLRNMKRRVPAPKNID